MCGIPQIQATVRSTPRPNPEWTKRAVFPQVEVPAVGLQRQPFLLDAADQLVVVVLALAAADDLAVPLRRQHVVVEHGAGIGRVLLHIEGLDRPRVVVDHDRAVVLLGQQGLVVAAQVAPPLHGRAQASELFHRVGVGNAVKRGRAALQRRDVALQLRRARASGARDSAPRCRRRTAPAAACCRRNRSRPPPARPSRTRSGGGGSWTSRRGRWARSSRLCRGPPRRPRRRAGRSGRGRPCPGRSTRWRTGSPRARRSTR